MCWSVHIGEKEICLRDDLEAEIGMPVLYRDDDEERSAENHCLCSVDVPATMVAAGYWIRSVLPDDHMMAGDWIAKKADQNSKQ
jgi:hypothetical protein